MALSQPTLKAEFLKLMDQDDPNFVGWPATQLQGVHNWCNAYNAYAMHATDVSGDTVFTTNLAGMISTLAANMPDPATGTPAAGAAAFDLAFIAYWAGAIFSVGILPVIPLVCPNLGGTTIFSVETTSVVVTVAPDTLKNLLAPELLILSNDADVKADAFATIFHTATTTAVTALITGLDTTAPVPLPITNTCTIF